jgi:hypothetical protein
VLPVKSAFSGLKKTFKRIAKGLEKAKMWLSAPQKEIH